MRKLLILLLGLLLIFILSYFCFTTKSEGIQNDLLSKIQTLYSDKSISWVSVDIEGKDLETTRIVTLTGIATTKLEKEEAGKLALTVEGVSSINNKIVVDESLNMDYGHFDMKDETFNFEGYVDSESKKEEILSDLNSALSSNYKDSYNIEVPKIIALTPSLLDVNKSKKETSESNDTDIDINVSMQEEPIILSNAISCQDSFKEQLSKEKITFAYNKAVIKKKSYGLLDKLINIAQGCSSDKIVIEGHTDSDGSERYNQKLSEKRANAVKVYLVSHGVSKDRLESIGYGELHPIATNSTELGKKQNRRIEFNVKGVE